MNKQQQIEEMIMVMPEKIKDPLDNSRYILFGKSLRREIARIFYDAGYRKVDGDEYVSREWHDEQVLHAENEIKELKEQLAEYKKPIDKFIKDREAQAVKKFAEKVKSLYRQYEEVCSQMFCEDIDEWEMVKAITTPIRKYREELL